MDLVLLLVLILIPILATFAYASISGAPWVPTWRRDVERFLKLAQLRPGERFYDLGCGDGRLVVAAARAGAIATGYECSILPYVLAKLRVGWKIWKASFHFPSLPASGGGRAREGEVRIGRRGSVRYADFWNANLSDADVVYCFLMPKVYPELKEKLERECKPGTRIILYVWPMTGWTVDAKDDMLGAPKLYRHIIRNSSP